MSSLSDRLQHALGPAYRVERELGGGGMSHVFLAEEVALGRRVVVKVLPPELAAGVSAERFRREIQLAAQLQHPGIVPLLTAGADGDLLWYVMPYVEGESLRTRLARGPLPIDEAVRLWRDLLEALEYAHGRGIVHRDIKPENIMLTGRRAVTLDFGVAKAVSASTSGGTGSATGVGFVVGTPAYMAPEQAAGDGNVDGRADLYAAGLVLYEMLAGRGPFDARTPAEWMAAHIATVPTAIQTQCVDVDPRLSALLMQCLAKSPVERPSGAAAALSVLDATAMSSRASGRAETSEDNRGGSRLHAARNRTRAVVASCVILLMVGVLALWSGALSTNEERAAQTESYADSLRLQVALLPIVADARDSIMGQSLLRTQLNILRDEPRLLTQTPSRVRALAEDVGMLATDADSLRQLYRELGVHTYLQHTLVRSGEGVLLVAEGYASRNDSLLFRFEKPMASAAELSSATNSVSRQVGASLKERVGKIPRPPVTGRLLGTTPEAAELYLQARSIFDAGASAQAIPLLRAALRADPQFALAWSSLSAANNNGALSYHERFYATKRAFELKDRIPSKSRRVSQAIVYLRLSGQMDSARALATRASAEFPEDLDIKNHLSNILLWFRDYTLAAQVGKPLYERTLTTRTGRVGVENYIMALAEAGQVDAARAALTRMEGVLGKDELRVVVSRERLAGIALDPDSLVAAALHHIRVATDSVDRFSSYDRLIGAMLLQGRLDSVSTMEQVRRGSARSSGQSRTLVSSIAQEAYLRSLFGGPSRQRAAALDSALRSVRWDTLPALDRSFSTVIRAQLASGDNVAARRSIAEWERLVPAEMMRDQRPLIQAARGELALAEGNGKTAVQFFREANIGRCWACAASRLARAFDKLNEADSVIYWYEQALAHPTGNAAAREVYDEYPRAYRRLGELYEAKGDTKRAIQRYSDFVELWKNADPALQPLVKDVRERIARLQKKSG